MAQTLIRASISEEFIIHSVPPWKEYFELAKVSEAKFTSSFSIFRMAMNEILKLGDTTNTSSIPY
jgi:hypothetical protein